MFDALEQWVGNAEIRALAHLERLINNRFNRLEKRMSTQSDALNAAISGLSSKISDVNARLDAAKAEHANVQSLIDAAVAAQADGNDAVFASAAAQLTALSASIGEHLDSASAAASTVATDAAAVPAEGAAPEAPAA